jgi:hypothetical protein
MVLLKGEISPAVGGIVNAGAAIFANPQFANRKNALLLNDSFSNPFGIL